MDDALTLTEQGDLRNLQYSNPNRKDWRHNLEKTNDSFGARLCWLVSLRCHNGNWHGHHYSSNSTVIHAVGAPIFFVAVSRLYFKRFHFTGPLVTATVFVLFVIVVDFFVVALLINRSLAMFESWLGTWLPFVLIFGSTFLTGNVISKTSKPKAT
jgi:hypothetical protein